MNDDLFPLDAPIEEATPASATDDTARVLARLREALLATAPEVEPAEVRGDTLEELEASFAAAREAAERVRTAVRRELAAAVPAAAGSRLPTPPMTPFEKIRAGLAR